MLWKTFGDASEPGVITGKIGWLNENQVVLVMAVFNY